MVTPTLHQLNLHNTTELRQFIQTSFSHFPHRRDHILAVADFARAIATIISTKHPELKCDPDEAERAALLHDIGYLPEIQEYLKRETEFSPSDWHPIDGANYLRARGEKRLAEFIEGHGNSLEVARLKNLPLFIPSQDLIAKIVTFCDSQTGPSGERVSYEERLEEIKGRHGDKSFGFKAHALAKARTGKILEEIKALVS